MSTQIDKVELLARLRCAQPRRAEVLPYVRVLATCDGFVIETLDGKDQRIADDPIGAVDAAVDLSWVAYARLKGFTKGATVRTLFEVFIVDLGAKPRKEHPPKIVHHDFVIAADSARAQAKALIDAKLEIDVDSAQIIVRRIEELRPSDDD